MRSDLRQRRSRRFQDAQHGHGAAEREHSATEGGIVGCTHLRELLQQMGTVAFQTLYAKRVKRQEAANVEATVEANAQETAKQGSRRPVLLGTCLAYAPNSPVVKRYWPDSYTGE